jgi:hypothetical protein
MGIAKLAMKGNRGKTLLRASALIGAVVAGVVMEVLRRKYRGLRKVRPEFSAGRGHVRVGLRTASARGGSSRRRTGSRANGAGRLRRMGRALRSSVR